MSKYKNKFRYENLHKHTHKSNISTPDSVINAEDIAKRAVELGHKTLSTVEHGYAGDVFEYYDVAEKYGLKMVFGVEFYYVRNRFEKDRTNAHLLIMARTNNGKRELTKMITEANKTGYYHKPRIDEEMLFNLDPKDVIVTSTCIASPYNLYKDECFIQDCHEHFGDSFFLEIHDNTHYKQVEYNKLLLNMHIKYGIEFIFATDTHYILEEDAKWRDLFLKGKGIFYPEEDGFIMDYPTSDQVFERFEKQGVFTREQVESAMRNTWIVDDFEDIIMTKEIKMPTIYPNHTHEEKMKELKNIINNEWKKDRVHIPKEHHATYLEGIKYEMDIIEKTSTEDYFLLNYPIIKRAKELGGVLTRTGRGSAPSYYLNKLLGFTEVDRLDAPITLYPTRFMSISRILETKSLPDIDFNTADPRPFVQASKEILGEDNCYYMVAYGTMQESEAFRNLCRAYKIEGTDVNEVGKDLDSYRNHPKWKDLIEESKVFIGVIDSISPHPCANLLLSTPISEDIGVIRINSKKKEDDGAKEIMYCALIDSATSDTWKYLKNDYLVVTVWKIIANVFKEIGIEIPDVRTLSKWVEGEQDVWDLYEKGLTATLNQAGTDSGTAQVMQYKPKSIRELSGWVSAIRPSFSSMKHYFLNRLDFNYGIPEFDAILKESDNFILYQENIMRVLVYSGFPEDETYGLLKAIAKKKEGIIEPIHDRFIKGFVDRTGSEENALKVWQIIEDAVGYGFNSSHAYSVALDSVYGAWLKAKHPLDYFAIVLNIYEGKTAQTGKIMKEMDYFNINVEQIKFGKSKGLYSADHTTNSIFKGIASIKSMNAKVADELYELAKTTNHTDFIDLLVDITHNTIANKTHMETLIKLDFFSEFGHRDKLLEIFQAFKEGKGIKYDKGHIEKTRIKRLQGLRELATYIMEAPLEKPDLFSMIAFEKDVLGYAITKLPEVSKNIALVIDVNKKYKPKITLYQIATGKEFVVKVEKKKFYTNNDEDDMLYVGDIIKVLELVEKPAWKMVDGKFEKDETRSEGHLEKCEILRLSKNRK